MFHSLFSPQSQVASPSSYPHLCMRDLHLPVAVLRRLRYSQRSHASLEPNGRDSLGSRVSLCGAFWRCADQRAILWLWGLTWRGSTKRMKLFLDLSRFIVLLVLVGRVDEVGQFPACSSPFQIGPSSWCMEEQCHSAGRDHLLLSVWGTKWLLYIHHSGLGRSWQHGQICSKLAMYIRQRGLKCGLYLHLCRHLVLASFLCIEFLEPTLALVLAMWSL